MYNDHIVFRKFVNKTNSYVSVVSTDMATARGNTKINTATLSISDGFSQPIEFMYSFSNTDKELDTEYSRAIEELEVLRAAVSATIEEVASAYMNFKDEELDDEEEVYPEDNEDWEVVLEEGEIDEDVPF